MFYDFKKKKLIILISSVIILLSFIFISYQLFEKIETKYTFYNNIGNIKILLSKNTNIKVVEKYIIDISNLEKKLQNPIENIYMTSEDLNNKFDLNLNSKVLAISYGKDIYINTNLYQKNTILHESLHVYDYDNNWISSSIEFIELYNKNKELILISPGNIDSSGEFFATSLELFYDNPDAIKKIDLNLFIFFQNLEL